MDCHTLTVGVSASSSLATRDSAAPVIKGKGQDVPVWAIIIRSVSLASCHGVWSTNLRLSLWNQFTHFCPLVLQMP
jgi:hypothetical protein